MAKNKDSELDQYTQELWDTIMRLIHSFRTSMSTIEEIEITFPQTMLLLELYKAGEFNMGELAQRLRISQGVATRMVDRLLERGLVERSRDEEDRRIVIVVPTQQGARIAREIEAVNKEKIGELLQAIPAKERTYLLELFNGLERQFEKEETG
jgi:DNA-binding MarR family transcriptional regulator